MSSLVERTPLFILLESPRGEYQPVVGARARPCRLSVPESESESESATKHRLRSRSRLQWNAHRLRSPGYDVSQVIFRRNRLVMRSDAFGRIFLLSNICFCISCKLISVNECFTLYGVALGSRSRKVTLGRDSFVTSSRAVYLSLFIILRIFPSRRIV